MATTNESADAKRHPGYAKRPNDLITATECALLIRGELQRYQRERTMRRRLARLVRRIFGSRRR